MNKCPLCLNVLSVNVEVCQKCGFSLAEDITKALVAFGLDKTQATKILSDEKMTPEKWQKIKGLFEAVQDVSLDKRGKFLKNACGDDDELKAEVEKLLNSFENAESFLESPVVGEAVSMFEHKKTLLANKTTGEFQNGNFVAGTVLAERYRIIGLLGRGGMGEVYKAEDLMLNQTVALKFLPDKLSKNEDALRRFIGEVKTARQVSHENVCRVFDIGEIEGNRYLSMEFIEGDDLSQLLNRIGRLPSDKAIEISRQICLGLNAIHKTGILHRDLKPANIIIDKHGKARITDFGIAGFEADVQGEESKIGTPAYMSPEQVKGKEVTQKSDIYSLGLLLYEMFTGKQAFEADSIPELLEKQSTDTPTTLSEIIEGIDPQVERIITQCLEKNPAHRPESALQVAMRLPGGNPLEVALEAGETPTPEMVAAAPTRGALKPLIALGLLIGFAGMFSLIMYWSSVYSVNAYTPLDKSPEVLAERAKTVIKNLGFTEPPADTNFKFIDDRAYKKFAEERDKPREWWEKIRSGQPFHTYFLYRQSPEDLLLQGLNPFISENEPSLTMPGMINVKLDVHGRLIELKAIPSLEVRQTEQTDKTDWEKVFSEAGLNIEKFKEIEPKWNPTVFADESKQWQGTLADFPDIPVRINGSALDGKPVEFKIVPSWNEPSGETQTNIQQTGTSAGQIFINVVILLVLIGSVLLVRYNLKNGRGDLKGAVKIAIFCFSVQFFGGIIGFDSSFKGGRIFAYAMLSLFTPLVFFLFYLALEPFVRKRWTKVLISWNRLLIGDFRNPMIGRDILIGLFLGISYWIVIFGIRYLESFQSPDLIFDPFNLRSFGSSSVSEIGTTVAILLNAPLNSLGNSLLVLFVLLIFSIVFKKNWIAVLAMVLLFFLQPFFNFLSDGNWSDLVSGTLWILFVTLCLVRFGFLAATAFIFIIGMPRSFAITFDTTSFYFPTTVLAFSVAFIIAAYAYYISTAGQSIFKKDFLE